MHMKKVMQYFFGDLLSATASEEVVDTANLCVLCKEIINFRSEGLNVETIQTVFAEYCYKSRQCLLPRSSLSDMMDIPLWFAIASYAENTTVPKDHSAYWSNSIAYFISKNQIDTDVFRTLTNKSLIPTINPNAAVILLREERRHGLHECCNNEKKSNTATTMPVEDEDVDVVNGSKKNDKDIDDTTMLSNLQERCIESFNLANLEHEDNEDLREKVLDAMSHTMTKTYLRKTLSRTRKIQRKSKEAIQKVINENLTQWNDTDWYDSDSS